MERGTTVTLECASSAASFTWLFDNSNAIVPVCTSADQQRFIASQPDGTDSCYLTALGDSDIEGPYTCNDFDKIAEAVIVVIGKLQSFEINVS